MHTRDHFIRMVGAQGAEAVREHLSVEVDRLIEVTPRLIGTSEIVGYGEGVWVGGSKDTGVVGEDLFVHPDGIMEISCSLVRVCKVV